MLEQIFINNVLIGKDLSFGEYSKYFGEEILSENRKNINNYYILQNKEKMTWEVILLFDKHESMSEYRENYVGQRVHVEKVSVANKNQYRNLLRISLDLNYKIIKSK